MSKHTEAILSCLFSELFTARQLSEKLEISQPSISRALQKLDGRIIKSNVQKSIHYALRDDRRGLPEIPIYRVNIDGEIKKLGTLIPVRPEGFIMCQENGKNLHSDNLPWWLFDMTPQGYLGRAYATRYATDLGLPSDIKKWNDTDCLCALLAHSHDAIGNLLLGDIAKDKFVNTLQMSPITEDSKQERYIELAKLAASGGNPGSSAGGEQPKFTAYVSTPEGAKHVIVKFTDFEDNSVSERWRDLLLAEHLALETLRDSGISAANSTIVDIHNQRFLEVERFDRIGEFGRRAVFSLKALDLEFVGKADESWGNITQALAKDKQVDYASVKVAKLLWAFGTLIGNTDMHNGNLSFVSEHGRPYSIAPAYDVTPMAFAPKSGGGLVDALSAPNITSNVDNRTWKSALNLADTFLAKIIDNRNAFSDRFSPCIEALSKHIEIGKWKIKKLG
jgi:hypothetical protein